MACPRKDERRFGTQFDLHLLPLTARAGRGVLLGEGLGQGQRTPAWPAGAGSPPPGLDPPLPLS